jgi:hypothetical protein
MRMERRGEERRKEQGPRLPLPTSLVVIAGNLILGLEYVEGGGRERGTRSRERERRWGR